MRRRRFLELARASAAHTVQDDDCRHIVKNNVTGISVAVYGFGASHRADIDLSLTKNMTIQACADVLDLADAITPVPAPDVKHDPVPPVTLGARLLALQADANVEPREAPSQSSIEAQTASELAMVQAVFDAALKDFSVNIEAGQLPAPFELRNDGADWKAELMISTFPWKEEEDTLEKLAHPVFPLWCAFRRTCAAYGLAPRWSEKVHGYRTRMSLNFDVLPSIK